MLLLTIKIKQVRCAIRAVDVVEVVPMVSLRREDNSQLSFLGFLVYHGASVPVFDLGRWLGGEPTRASLSTRIILVADGAASKGPSLGLVAEEVTETVSLSGDRLAFLDELAPASFDDAIQNIVDDRLPVVLVAGLERQLLNQDAEESERRDQ